jgi:hypothetical protein
MALNHASQFQTGELYQALQIKSVDEGISASRIGRTPLGVGCFQIPVAEGRYHNGRQCRLPEVGS